MSFTLTRGTVPLLISFPHSGTHVPPDLARLFTPEALLVPDTDWHVPALYAFARELGAWTLEAHMNRFVIDLNRDPTGASLYPGQSTTTLCPIDTFDMKPVYAGAAPTLADIEHRVQTYWHPYHQALAQAIDTIRAAHGAVIVWDAHSIRSEVPRFFEGRLKPLNLGTANAASCAAPVRAAVIDVLHTGDLAVAVDERFVGGYITRHYGDPQNNVHTLQMEIAQSAYMNENSDLALQPLSARALSALLRRACCAALRQIQ